MINLKNLSDDEILNLKFSELKLEIKGSILEGRINALYDELKWKDLIYRPHLWISDEWFTPDDVPGFAVPFYLVNKRLVRIEKTQMFEAEGLSKSECMQILRHETGHAISHAYRLYYNSDWKKHFGNYKKKYPVWYVPDIKSKNYVTHLNAWYAQAHPLEDFAESFAVWLDPESKWRRKYSKWPAMKKLNYIDNLMIKIKKEKPVLNSQEEYAPLSELHYTIREHYRRKKKFYSADWAESFDIELQNVFSSKRSKKSINAADAIRKMRKDLRKNISSVLDIPQYTVDQIVMQMMKRSIRLNLYSNGDIINAEKKILIILTSQLTNILQKGYKKIPL